MADDKDKDKEIEREIKKEGDKVQPKNALPQIRAKIKAQDEKGKKTKGKKRGEK